MKRLFASTTLAIALVISPFATTSVLAHDSMQGSPRAEKAPYDVQFLDTMVMHHQEALDMSQMALDKAQNAKVKSLAQRIIDDQKEEINELKKMRKRVDADASKAVNRKLPGMMPMDMQKLESATGNNFDRMFLDMMLKHHKGAIEMSQAELEQGNNSEAKAKAKIILDKQTKEIAEMKQLREGLKGSQRFHYAPYGNP